MNYYQRNDKRIYFWDSILLWSLVKASSLFREDIDVQIKRFIDANNLTSSRKAMSLKRQRENGVKIDLVTVASDKDFHLLPLCINFAIRSLGHSFSGNFFVVVPAVHLENCKNILKRANLRDGIVINEEDLISSKNRKLLRDKFGERFGWVLQQLLKVIQVLRCKSNQVLIVDSDTLLITERLWIAEEKSLITASWEFHPSYYSFLNDLGIGEKNPTYTFVTHHMLMSTRYLQSALEEAGFKSPEDLIPILTNRDWKSFSPFCLEYELYGQYMFHFHRDKIRIEKWGNRAVNWNDIKDLSMEEITCLFRNFDSISAHSYLD